MNWYLALLDGQEFRPDSGNTARYEGVIDDGEDHYDTRYWHPHGTPDGKEDDDARSKYGFPVVPNLLNSCRAAFKATGLNFPWYAVHGNHDALLQGTVAPESTINAAMIAGKRYTGLPSHVSLAEVLSSFQEIGPAGYPESLDAPYVEVSADIERRAVQRGEFAAMHLASPGLPVGHGFNQTHVENKHMYYAINIGAVNLVVLASHHPLSKMFNSYAPTGRRVCVEEIQEMLLKYPHVIAWFAGHEHRHHIKWIGRQEEVEGFWQIETASHADWPQQSRTIEIVKDSAGDIFLGLSIIDHAGGADYKSATDPIEIAALSRAVSANVWQKRPELGATHDVTWWSGRPEDRNVVLKVKKR